MVEKTATPEPTARAEVGRYCWWPTQASSYLTGCLEIMRIRDRFLESRGLPQDRAQRHRSACCASSTIAWRRVDRCRSGWPNERSWRWHLRRRRRYLGPLGCDAGPLTGAGELAAVGLS